MPYGSVFKGNYRMKVQSLYTWQLSKARNPKQELKIDEGWETLEGPFVPCYPTE